MARIFLYSLGVVLFLIVHQVRSFNPNCQMVDGTMIVDQHGDDEAELPEAHCDDEHIEECHNRLKNNLTTIRDLLQQGNVGNARETLGRMLHTLQDFYSHSNWIELHGDGADISNNLAQKWPLEFPVDKTIPSCINCTYPDAPSGAAAAEIAYVDAARSFAPNVDRRGDQMSVWAKGYVSAAILAKKYGLTIIYRVFQATVGKELPPNAQLQLNQVYQEFKSFLDVTPNCKAALIPPFTAQYLTTGYFGTNLKIHSRDPTLPRKCSHGGQYDRDTYGIEGISKDTASGDWSPRPDLHEQAASLALKATKVYLDYVKQTVCNDVAPKDCADLKALYGIGPSLTFVIDTTGSMGSVIAAVRDAAIQIVNKARALPDSQSPSLYVLAPFNDPVVPDATTYTDPDKFITDILKLDADGGGDCPELAMTGLSKAVAATPAGGNIFLWTDAGAKDAYMATDVANAARNKSQAITVFQFTSSCSDPTGFDTVTKVTGGDLRPNLPYARADYTAALAGLRGEQDIVTFFKIIGNNILNFINPIHKRADGPSSVTFDVPVDASVSFLGFAVNSSAITMSIARPDGSVVGATDTGVTTLDAGLSGITETITSPATGVWKITLSGTGALSFSVFGTTPLLFSSFNFVESAGARHDGLFPVAVPPTPGSSSVLAMATLEGPVVANGSAVFEFRGLDNTLLGSLDGLLPGSGADMEMPSNIFIGNVTIPTQAFNIYVRGKDSAGHDFLRLLPGLLDLPSAPTGNGTIGTNSTTSLPPYSNTTLTATTTSTATVCPTCQPQPCETAVTELIRTIVYFTTCPGCTGECLSPVGTAKVTAADVSSAAPAATTEMSSATAHGLPSTTTTRGAIQTAGATRFASGLAWAIGVIVCSALIF
ncbi:hypothetical protein GQ53DRAFT_770466 [Thozetella sp. PMI_491]|nr:hypothetical protein GQ53DRAFT_770466 [Thozetella sp. PMI_491]